jgi:uncharacterized coiled-coil protein SlyX
MSDELQLERPAEEPSNPLRPARRGWPLVLVLLIVLALVGSGGVYAWANMGPLIQSLARQAPDGAADPGDKAAIPELLATQQKANEDLEALSKAVAGQQQELKRVTDQLTALNSKVDAMQRPVLPLQAVLPAVASQPPAPIAQAAPKPRKPAPPRTPKPTGPISTGGAPLTASPDAGTR